MSGFPGKGTGAATRWQLMVPVGLAVAMVAWAYFATFSSMVQKWSGDAAFSHGFLILPISLWLAWRQRHTLANTNYTPSMLGLPLVALCVLAWVIARGSGVLVIEQFAAIALIPTLVLAGLGPHATRVLLVPLAFLFFMVPFGRGFVPYLMQATAGFSTVLLDWSGVPVHRTHMYISIPDGSFEVARECSGLNYFTTSLVLGVLYAHLNFRSWTKKITCVAAFVVLPIVLNGLRVYITILVSHLTQMRFGPGAEHVTFGRIFFIVVMLVLFWIGRRWHDEPPSTAIDALPRARSTSQSWNTVLPLLLASILALTGPPFAAASVSRTVHNLSDRERLVRLPEAAGEWGRSESGDPWRPLYRGGLLERQARYLDGDGKALDVFVSVYGLGRSVGAEMISYNNMLVSEELGSLTQDLRREVSLEQGDPFHVREVVVRDGESTLLVWHWYVVGERPVLGQFATKALEAVAFVTRNADSERIITLATPFDEQAHVRLQAFVDAHGRCVVRGFQAKDCSG